MTHYSQVEDQDLPTPLHLDAWVEWNERKFGLTAVPLTFGAGGKAASLRSLLYVNGQGRVAMPPLSPHLPLSFTTTPTSKVDRIYSQWVDLAGALAEQIASRGIAGRINLPPTFVDARPFQWAGLQAEWRYTFVADLGTDTAPDSAVRKRLRKAQSRGYTVEVGGDPGELHACLLETERRKGFAHRLTRRDLKLIGDAMGPSHYRVYLVRDASGTAVSAGARLLSEGGWGVDWLQGTSPDHLENGANQLIYQEVFRDLRAQGVRLFDLGGANIRAVARAKSSWGHPLVPYISLTAPSATKHLRQAMVGSLGPVLPALRRARAVTRRGA